MSLLGWLKALFLDKRAREALRRLEQPKPSRPTARQSPSRRTAPPPPRERSSAEALAEAEERMKVLPPEKAQLIRTAKLIHRASQGALGDLSDEERARLEGMAKKALLRE